MRPAVGCGQLPLLLLVHGRSGGLIPPELEELAAELADRRRGPVQLVTLSGGPEDPAPPFLAAVQARGGLELVPLLLLPGGHVRRDLPAICERWRRVAPLLRRPFLGAWPPWQRLLTSLVEEERERGRSLLWLHHPVEGDLPERYLAHLSRVSGTAALATPFDAVASERHLPRDAALVWQPLALAANRLTEALEALPQRPRLRPPLLQQAGVRRFLLEQLQALPGSGC